MRFAPLASNALLKRCFDLKKVSLGGKCRQMKHAPSKRAVTFRRHGPSLLRNTSLMNGSKTEMVVAVFIGVLGRREPNFLYRKYWNMRSTSRKANGVRRTRCASAKPCVCWVGSKKTSAVMGAL